MKLFNLHIITDKELKRQFRNARAAVRLNIERQIGVPRSAAEVEIYQASERRNNDKVQS
jgi:hypothetical protein